KDEKTGSLLPSEIALELWEQYREVLVDEYQDINDIQETILHLVSRQGTESPNLFMVGDVNQSIYRFRLANPLLFLKKLHSFRLEKNSRDRKITLAANFRSRETVVEGVNFLFRRLMTPEVGELEYDREAELVCRAVYPEPPEGMTAAGSTIEVHLIERNDVQEEDETGGQEDLPGQPGEDLTALEKEARIIATRIQQMVGAGDRPEFVVWDKEEKSYRPVTYRDIAICLRSPRVRANTFLEVFREYDIPIFAELGTGYFRAMEIHVMLSLLQVIDNPRQDIPLAAVLRSPLVSLTARELAEIRALKKSGDFYGAVIAARQRSCNRKLQNKLDEFLARLHAWRTVSRRGPLSSLIWGIYQETGYLDYAAAMPGGSQRQANLYSLYERAAQFDRFTRRGLFRFLRFIEKLQERGQDLGTAGVLGENENVVRLLSVHKSKGLEFPVVFLAGLGNEFNFRDLSQDLLFHQELGFGPMVIDPSLSLKYPSMAYWAVRNSLKRADLAEEMRVLYVALTRAREKLILVGSTRELGKQRQEWSDYANGEEPLPVPLLASARCYLDWLGPALAGCEGHNPRWDICCWGNEGGRPLPEIPSVPPIHHLPWDRIKSLQPLEGSPQPDVRRELDRRLNWVYPMEDLTRLPAKLAATEIPPSPLILSREDEEAVPLFRPRIKAKPLFLQEKAALSPAQLGTAVHLVMQHLNFDQVGGEDEIERQIASLAEKGFLTEEEAASLDPRPIAGFFRQPLGLRILAAPREAIRREVAFTLALPAEEVYPDLLGRPGGRDPVLIQGII
ncbi:MAG TPA: UvrD-helicase domain-containing protein, partial [Clostridia bacterium]|nr:UvrD-helicase domain-containing protein [Clostridia bacterium]